MGNRLTNSPSSHILYTYILIFVILPDFIPNMSVRECKLSYIYKVSWKHVLEYTWLPFLGPNTPYTVISDVPPSFVYFGQCMGNYNEINWNVFIIIYVVKRWVCHKPVYTTYLQYNDFPRCGWFFSHLPNILNWAFWLILYDSYIELICLILI